MIKAKREVIIINNRDWLKEYRLKAGYTQEKLSQKSGISQNYYSMIETNERDIRVPTAKKIAEVLGFDWTKFYE